MRRTFAPAIALLLVGCSSHSAAPIPDEFTGAAPEVHQRQPLIDGAWTWAIIPHVGGHLANPLEITSDTHANIWVADFNPTLVTAVSKISMGQNVTTYPLSIAPSDVAGGPDGNVWVTSGYSGVIARVSPSGVETDYTVAPGSNVSTMSIATGPDGALWFTLEGDAPYGVGRITTSGVSTLYTAISGADGPIVTGPDGNLWLGLNHDAPNVYSVTPHGVLSASYVLPGNAVVEQLTTGPDGAMWIAAGPVLGRITTTGSVSTFAVPGNNGNIVGIATGLDGNLWMSYAVNGTLNLITFNPTLSTFGEPVSSPVGIGQMLVGPDKNFWFSGAGGEKVPSYVNLAMTVSPASLTIAAPGQTGTLTISETNYAKRWSATSTNPAVATVPSEGTRKPIVVTAIGVGSCTVVISDHFYNRVRVKITVQ